MFITMGGSAAVDGDGSLWVRMLAGAQDHLMVWDVTTSPPGWVEKWQSATSGTIEDFYPLLWNTAQGRVEGFLQTTTAGPTVVRGIAYFNGTGFTYITEDEPPFHDLASGAQELYGMYNEVDARGWLFSMSGGALPRDNRILTYQAGSPGYSIYSDDETEAIRAACWTGSASARRMHYIQQIETGGFTVLGRYNDDTWQVASGTRVRDVRGDLVGLITNTVYNQARGEVWCAISSTLSSQRQYWRIPIIPA
jgi:hypothetical protein